MTVHQQFLARLDKSHEAVIAVASWLSNRGNSVTISGLHRAPTAADWQDFADSGDLFINQRVEVKCLTHDFTCHEDWTFKDKFIVCAKAPFDRYQPKPYAFVYVNKSHTHAGIVVVSQTQQHWWTEDKEDKNYPGAPKTFYVMPTKLVKFVEMKR